MAFYSKENHAKLLMENIICDKCNKKVDRYCMQINHMNNTNIFMVECHGEKEICELSIYDLSLDKTDIIAPGRAFTSSRLSHHLSSEN